MIHTYVWEIPAMSSVSVVKKVPSSKSLLLVSISVEILTQYGQKNHSCLPIVYSQTPYLTKYISCKF